MLVSAGADLRVILWDVTDPTHPRPLGLPVTGHADPVKSLSLSRDGRTLASGSFSEVQLWDLTDLAQPRPLGPPLAGDLLGADALLFSPDGNTLITGDFGPATTRDLSQLNALRDNTRRVACDRTGRGLNPDEWARYVQGIEYQDTCSG